MNYINIIERLVPFPLFAAARTAATPPPEPPPLRRLSTPLSRRLSNYNLSYYKTKIKKIK